MCRKQQTIISPPAAAVVQVTDSYILRPVTKEINQSFGGFYIGLPPHYTQKKDSFPLLVFFHGLGQMGDGKDQLKYTFFDGIGKLLKEKRFPLSFSVKNKEYSFIIGLPQYAHQPTTDEVMEAIEYITSRYPVRKDKIYLSGLSLGGRLVTLAAAANPLKFAAIVPIAGVATNDGMEERCKQIADANLPVWELHNADDPMASVADAQRFIQYILNFKPAISPRFTVFNKYGHDAWTTALDPTFREGGLNIYEWMLQYSR